MTNSGAAILWLPTISEVVNGFGSVSIPWAAPAADRDPFWQRFLTSAGFGGLMALAAALIAARFASAQLRHTKAQQQHERWWETLTWVYDRAVVEKDKRRALPHQVTFTMLTQLAERAQAPPEDKLQQHTIRSILSMFQISNSAGRALGGDSPGESSSQETHRRGTDGEAEVEPTSSRQDPPSDATPIQVSDPTAVELLDALRATLTTPEDIQRESERLHFFSATRELLKQSADRLGAALVGVPDSQQRMYFAVTWPNKKVLVDVMHTDSRMHNVAVLHAIDRLQAAVAANYAAMGGLVILNRRVNSAAVESFLSATHGPRVEIVTWDSHRDGGVILEALQRFQPSDAGPDEST